MKTLSLSYISTRLMPALLFCVAGLGLGSCEKSVEIPDVPPVVPASADPTGGTWKTVVIAPDTLLLLPAPLDSTSAAYTAEIAEIKTLQAGISSQKTSDVKYWSAGAVTRWNDITRALVTKYNVAPPVGATPDPTKPFANPVIASRMYALLSVAQYDALVCAWSDKYRYSRTAPYKVDVQIKQLTQIPDAPSYPSEHAVVAGASAEILKFLFPAEVAYIDAKLQNHKESRIVAGVSTRSEVTAGDSLGRMVARRIIDRAKTDGTKTAGAGTPPDVPNVWKSLEIPARPAMLPSWGKVKPWLMTAGDQFRAETGPPPAVGSPEFQRDLAEVKKYSDEKTREEWRIADFWADGAGTSTPPGHWNQIAVEIIRKNNLSEIRSARAMALLNMAVMDAGISCWDAKYTYWLPRPSQIDPEIKTSTGIPNFPAYTSGHSTFSGAATEILSYLFPAEEARMRTYGQEAALSRLYGCIHYRFDCEGALVIGQKIGKLAADRGRSDGSPAQ